MPKNNVYSGASKGGGADDMSKGSGVRFPPKGPTNSPPQQQQQNETKPSNNNKESGNSGTSQQRR